jgi:hypothetical protein
MPWDVDGREEEEGEEGQPPCSFSSLVLPCSAPREEQDSVLPVGAIVRPFAECPAVQEPPPALCGECAAYMNRFCSLRGGSAWTCCFCGTENCFKEDGSRRQVDTDVQYILPSTNSFVAGVAPDIKLATGPFRNRGGSRSGEALIWVIDGTMPGAMMRRLAESLRLMRHSNAAVDLLGLIIYTGAVSVYRLGRAGAAVAEVLPGLTPLSDPKLDYLLGERAGSLFVEAHEGWDAMLDLLVLLAGPVEKKGPRRKSWCLKSDKKRCLGAAVECGLWMARASGCRSSRLLVLSSGCPNYGPGAVSSSFALGSAGADIDDATLALACDYFSALSDKALTQGTGIDVFCAGFTSVGAPAISALVQASGGYALSLPDFSADLARTLERSLSGQFMSRVGGKPGCIVDIRTSNGWSVHRVICPGARSWDAFKQVDPAADLFEGAWDMPEWEGLHRLSLGRQDRSTSLALYLCPVPDEMDGVEDEMHLQVVVKVMDREGTAIVRVITSCAKVSFSLIDYFKSLNPIIAGSLIAKQVLLQSLWSSTREATDRERMSIASAAVDHAVRGVGRLWRYCSSMSNEEPSRGALSIPAQLTGLFEILFHLRRGTLLGNTPQNSDERHLSALLLLKLGAEGCVRSIVPALYMYVADSEGEPSLCTCHLETLAMLPDRILVMDAWDCIYVWRGDATEKGSQVWRHCKSLALHMAKGRFPSARLMCLEPGSPGCRYLTSRLEPSHRDPQWCLAQRENLNEIDLAAMSELHAEFPPSDDMSLREYMWKMLS